MTAAAPLVLSISEIQGDGFESPYVGQYVQTTGIVTADFQGESKRGFFLQDPNGDDNPATSDGIFIYDRWPYVDVGDELLVKGYVSEYYGLTEFYYPYYTIVSSDNPIPAPIELNPPFDDYDSDVYYEALECMLVSVSDMKVVEGTNGYGECAGVVEDLNIERVFEDDPAGTGELIFTDDASGVYIDAWSGNLIKGLWGPLDYTYDEYKILPVESPEVIQKGAGIKIGGPRIGKGDFSIATYNMYNLFDENDDPGKEDPVDSAWWVDKSLSKHAYAIENYLMAPDLIAVQEVEKIEMLQRLANDYLVTEYGVVLIDGPDNRGIDVGLLYRVDRVTVLSAEARQTCTTLNDAYGPGTDPNFPCPEGTNPLFSRPPLVVNVEVTNTGENLWLIINHFKSKGVYEPYYADPTPRRIEQAEWVSGLVDEIQTSEPNANVIVIGDLNDFEDSEPIQTLVNGGLSNLVLEVEKEKRYTYIYRGVSEVLDHILITPSLETSFDEAMVVHFNPDFPYFVYAYNKYIGIRSTDHDILLTIFNF
jgi:predicted extracellular nuclease